MGENIVKLNVAAKKYLELMLNIYNDDSNLFFTQHSCFGTDIT